MTRASGQPPGTGNDTHRAWLQAMQAGQALYARGQTAQAERAFLQATALQPARMEGWANLGGTLLDLDRPAEACEALERARALAPTLPAVLLNLGRCYYLLGRTSEALAACRAATALAPSADAFNKLGVILRASWKLDEAEAAFRAALTHDGGHPLAQVNLATLLMLMGRQADARPLLAAAQARPLPPEARHEAVRAALLLDEWERLDPVLQRAFGRASFDELIAALDDTPPALMQIDPVVGPFMARLAHSASRQPGRPGRKPGPCRMTGPGSRRTSRCIAATASSSAWRRWRRRRPARRIARWPSAPTPCAGGVRAGSRRCWRDTPKPPCVTATG